MKRVLLDESEYRDKVYGCWLGKNIGGTLGAPFEGTKYVNDLDFFSPVPEGVAPNDDLDLQLVWLKMLEERGVDATLPDFADYWMRHLSAYPWNEYGFCHRNLERGLRPPISGCFENYFVDEMGSPIRSEIWGCIAPGDPQLAASMAWNDSVLDHAGGEGTYGEMFWAAVESAAFAVNDAPTLIKVGLQMIPISSGISRVVREAVWCYEKGIRWSEARNRIVTFYGHYQPCHAVQNHGFIVLGWLYGRDFGDRLCKAVNAGYDTDCTGATLGSVLGIMEGNKGVPEKWRGPVGDAITLHKFTRLPDAPRTLDELTDRTVAIARRTVAMKSDTVSLGQGRKIPDDLLSLLFRNERALAATQQDVQASVAVDRGLQIWLHYFGEPVIYPKIEKTIGVSVRKGDEIVEGNVTVIPPPIWRMKRLPDRSGQKHFTIVGEKIEDRNTLEIRVTIPDGERHASFVILGPSSTGGYASGRNVPKCKVCGGYEGSCVCR